MKGRGGKEERESGVEREDAEGLQGARSGGLWAWELEGTRGTGGAAVEGGQEGRQRW